MTWFFSFDLISEGSGLSLQNPIVQAIEKKFYQNIDIVISCTIHERYKNSECCGIQMQILFNSSDCSFRLSGYCDLQNYDI